MLRVLDSHHRRDAIAVPRQFGVLDARFRHVVDVSVDDPLRLVGVATLDRDAGGLEEALAAGMGRR